MEITDLGAMKGYIEGRDQIEGYGDFVKEIMTRVETYKHHRTLSMNNISNTTSSLHSDHVMSVSANSCPKYKLKKSTVRRKQPTSSMIFSSPTKSVTSVDSFNGNSILVWSLIGDSSLEGQYIRRFCKSKTNGSTQVSSSSKSKSPRTPKRYISLSNTRKDRSRKVQCGHSTSSTSNCSESCQSSKISKNPFRSGVLNNISRKGVCSRTTVSDQIFRDEDNVYEKRKFRSDSHLFKRSQCSTQCLPLEVQRLALCSKRSSGPSKETSNLKSSGSSFFVKGSSSKMHRRCLSHLSRKPKHKNQNPKTPLQTFSKRVTTSQNDVRSSPMNFDMLDIKMDKKCIASSTPRKKYSIVKKIRQFCKHLKNNSNRETRTLAIL